MNTSSPHTDPDILELEGIELNRRAHGVRINGKPVFLGYKEFQVLWLLFLYRGAIVRVRDINEKLWGDPFGAMEETVACLVGKIRGKLGSQGMALIQNVLGIGYKIDGRPMRRSITRESAN